MKNSILILLFFFVSIAINAQTTKDLFNESSYNYTYLGIDYSHCQFVGEFNQFAAAGGTSMVTIKEEYFQGWNAVVIRESDKYDLKGALRKEAIKYSITEVAEINDNTVVETMEALEGTEFSDEAITNIVSNYNFKEKDGVGIIFIAEQLNKIYEKGTFHFVIFNLSNNEILLHERYEEEAGGFGLRNYWIRPVYEAIEKINKSYKKWRKEYAN